MSPDLPRGSLPFSHSIGILVRSRHDDESSVGVMTPIPSLEDQSIRKFHEVSYDSDSNQILPPEKCHVFVQKEPISLKTNGTDE